MTHIVSFPFHIGDFLSEAAHMDAEEAGAFMFLLLAHYRAGAQGLEDDDTDLARIAHVDKKKWSKLRPRLEKMFSIEGGFWINKRCVENIEKINDKSAAARSNVMKRKDRQSTPVLQGNNDCNTNHKPITNNQITNNPLTPFCASAAADGPDVDAHGSAGEAQAGRPAQAYDVTRYLTDEGFEAVKRAAPGWDIYYLARVYSEWAAGQGNPPYGYQEAARRFSGWCKTYTKGKSP